MWQANLLVFRRWLKPSALTSCRFQTTSLHAFSRLSDGSHSWGLNPSVSRWLSQHLESVAKPPGHVWIWVAQHSGLEILAEWAGAKGLAERAVAGTPLGSWGGARLAQDTIDTSMSQQVELYGEALDFFSEAVGAVERVGGTVWQRSTECDGYTVLDVVLAIAQDQYRLALQIEGRPAVDIEREVPSDPLGFQRLDGWRLAAERARLALSGELTADRSAQTVDVLVPDLREQISRMVRLGRCIRHAAEVEIEPGTSLAVP